MMQAGVLWLLACVILAGCIASAGPVAPAEAPKFCRKDSDCAFVREPICGAVDAITAGKEREWEAWKVERTKRIAEEKHYCRPGVGERKFSEFTAHCTKRECEAWPKPVKP